MFQDRQQLAAAAGTRAETAMEQELHHRPIELPPGFRFHPTDEELITHYLARKVADARFATLAVGEADLNKSEPWDLPSLAKMGEKEWYFFCLKDRKYPTGLRTNRATEAGYWKATGKDKDIFRQQGNGSGSGGKALVGSKKTLVFYTGRAPKGEKSGWVMHEYRLHGKLHGAIVPKAAAGSKNEWVLCRVFKKSLVVGVAAQPAAGKRGGMEMAKMEDIAAISHLPPLMDMSGGAGGAGTVNRAAAAHVTCFSDALEGHQFFNQLQTPPEPEAAATDHLGGLAASSSPFLSAFAHYGPLLHHGGASLVQLLEGGGVYGGGGRDRLPDMSIKQQQPVPAPSPACKQGGERERLSASQDTGLTSDVHPEISSSSGAQRFDHDHLCWGGY